MHPVMVTVPGTLFKILAPAMILWGLYSLIVALNRRGGGTPSPAGRPSEGAGAKAAKDAGEGASQAKPKVKRRRAEDAGAKTESAPEATESERAAAKGEGEGKGTGKGATTDAAGKGGAADAEGSSIAAPDSPANALISVAIGIGLFVYASPVRVQGEGIGKLFAALGAFFRGVVDRGVWSASWTSLPIYSYGVMLGTSLVVGWYITLGLAERDGLPRDRMADCYVFTAFSAILGSRILYVITNLHEFSDPTTHQFMPMRIFELRSGGLVAYGGFLGGLVGSIIFLKRNGFSLWKWADAAVPSLATGLMITRLGCYMYGCDFGKPLPQSAPGFLRALGTFPHWADDKGSPAWQQQTVLGFRTEYQRCIEQFHGEWRNGMCHLDHAARHSVPVHPTQLYESLTGLVLFVTLMWLWRRRSFQGQIFLAFGALYGFARSALEIIRDDHERGFLAGLSTSQIIGLSTGVICAVLYVVRRKSGPRAEPVNLFAPIPAAAAK